MLKSLPPGILNSASRSSRPSPGDLEPRRPTIFTPRVLPGAPIPPGWPRTPHCQSWPMSTHTCQDKYSQQSPPARNHAEQMSREEESPQRPEQGQRRAPPPTGRRIGASGVVPPEEHCEPPARAQKGPEHRATPGGYGGKPPGVAIIGVPTGARNAGSDAPTGDQSIDMNRTRKHPLVCQDPITTRSRDEPEQAQSLTISYHRRQGPRGGGRFPRLLPRTPWSRGWRAASGGTP